MTYINSDPIQYTYALYRSEKFIIITIDIKGVERSTFILNVDKRWPFFPEKYNKWFVTRRLVSIYAPQVYNSNNWLYLFKLHTKRTKACGTSTLCIYSDEVVIAGGFDVRRDMYCVLWDDGTYTNVLYYSYVIIRFRCTTRRVKVVSLEMYYNT